MSVNQVTPNPTNKLTAAMVAAFAAEVIKLIVRNVWPQWYDEAVFVALGPVLVFAVGYLIKDDANTPPTPTVVRSPDK